MATCEKCGEPGRPGDPGAPDCRSCGWPGDYRGPLSRGRPRGELPCADCLGPTYVESSGDVVCGMDPSHRVSRPTPTPSTRREAT